jgi:UDPglucose 6-dehydrogenase
MKISVIGAGFVGLVTAVYFSDAGHDVKLIESDIYKKKQIMSGIAPFYENDLNPLLKKYIGKNLQVVSDIGNGIKNSDAVFVCVGTPLSDDGEIDLSHIEIVSKELGKNLKNLEKDVLVVVKSTVVPGTTEEICKNSIQACLNDQDYARVFFGMNPEFLREGTAVYDTFNPDRIILGADSEKAVCIFNEIYAFVSEDVPKFNTTIKTAELSKYASNAFFATLISFSNEIAELCDLDSEIDVNIVFKSLYADRRFRVPDYTEQTSSLVSYLWPGIGYGGSCFPKDVLSIIDFAKTKNVTLPVLQGVARTNAGQAKQIFNKFYDPTKHQAVGILGLSFKPDTDDIRSSKSLELIEEALLVGLSVYCYDPLVKCLTDQIYNDVRIQPSIESLLSRVDIIFLATPWREFLSASTRDMLIKFPGTVVDCRNAFFDDKTKKLIFNGPGKIN